MKHIKSEINLLRRAIYNQKKILENVQKKELRNNLIITGIPNDDMHYEEATFHTPYGKETVILSEVCEDVSAELYNVIIFPPAENRKKHFCKDLSHEYSDDQIELKKGILRHNNVQCDTFNIGNQIFLDVPEDITRDITIRWWNVNGRWWNVNGRWNVVKKN